MNTFQIVTIESLDNELHAIRDRIEFVKRSIHIINDETDDAEAKEIYNNLSAMCHKIICIMESTGAWLDLHEVVGEIGDAARGGGMA